MGLEPLCVPCKIRKIRTSCDISCDIRTSSMHPRRVILRVIFFCRKLSQNGIFCVYIGRH
nr:MAG TPA: hypothetical protein [Caudoviricetes sp.]